MFRFAIFYHKALSHFCIRVLASNLYFLVLEKRPGQMFPMPRRHLRLGQIHNVQLFDEIAWLYTQSPFHKIGVQKDWNNGYYQLF